MIKFDDIRRGRDIGLGERIITNVAQRVLSLPVSALPCRVVTPQMMSY